MKLYLFIFLFVFNQLAFATGLQSIDTTSHVQIQSVDFDLEVRGLYVSGVMNVHFSSRWNSSQANLRFVLPTDSVIHRAEIYIFHEEKWMVAETLGRKEGEIIYDSIVNQRRDPLLLQKIGTDLYRAKVFPINSQTGFKIRVYYAHTLEPVTDNNYQLRVAFANPNSTPSTPTDGITVSVLTDANYWKTGTWQLNEMGTGAISPLDEVSTPTTINLNEGTAFLNLEDFTMDSDIILPLSSSEPRVSGLFYQPEEPNLTGHLHAQWKPDFSAYPVLQESQPRNVVFVVDISGSMAGSKLAFTRQAIISILRELDKNDYFGLVAYDDDVYVFRPNMEKGNNIDTAIEWVSNLQAGNGSDMVAGLTTAASIGVRSPLTDKNVDLLLISDGKDSSTVTDILAEVEAEADVLGREVRIFGVGIGYNLDQDSLNELTQKTGGEATFALSDSEITGQVLDLFTRVRSGGLSDVKLQIEGTNHEFLWPRIFADKVLQVSARDIEYSDQVNLILQGNLPDATPIEITTTFKPLQVNDKITKVAVPLSAKATSDLLERQIDENGETKELVNMTLALGRHYGILNRYTSLLALETDEMYKQFGVDVIERDPAGIALEPIIVSAIDESRIGGQGTVDADRGETTIDDYQFGCPVLSSALVRKAESSYAEVFCETATLHGDLQLDIPRLNYRGNYYWVSLKLAWDTSRQERRVLKVMNYGPVASPKYNPSVCESDEIVLADDLRLEISFVATRGVRQFKGVVLQGMITDDGRLIFYIVNYK
ncbi:VWA domain-containing protein [Candidatus Halobeggiatoa sp. HSG11]|nr:VWA domain-containing protein [Candidatus Halobeggiatoa sp. HSG11]